MNKQKALEILQKHVDWSAMLNSKTPTDVKKEKNPNNIRVYIPKDSKELYEEFCKENGTVNTYFDQEGGEGEGEYYHIIMKIEHPVDGVAYLKYNGQYDSWNGVEWEYYPNPTLVEPVEVTVTQFAPVKE